MYNLNIFLKGTHQVVTAKYKTRENAYAARDNILAKKKDSIESGVNTHVSIKTEGNDFIDFFTEDYLATLLLFSVEGVTGVPQRLQS